LISYRRDTHDAYHHVIIGILWDITGRKVPVKCNLDRRSVHAAHCRAASFSRGTQTGANFKSPSTIRAAAFAVATGRSGTGFAFGSPLGWCWSGIFEMRAEGKAPLRIGSSKGDPICRLSEVELGIRQATPNGEVSFPYSFSRAGGDRFWVQIKVSGEILTGVFDLEVRQFRRLDSAHAF
jgi:hypothetical protein